MIVRKIDNNQSFGSWTQESQRRIAKVITQLTIDGKTKVANEAMSLFKKIENSSPNHRIYFSERLDAIASDSFSHSYTISKVPPKKLSASLGKVLKFLVADNANAKEMQKFMVDFVLPKLKVGKDKTILAKGWHLSDTIYFATNTGNKTKLQCIAEEIALLKSEKNGKKLVNQAIDIFNKIENKEGDYSIRYDYSHSVFKIHSYGNGKLRTIQHNGDILKTLKRINKAIDRDIFKNKIKDMYEKFLLIKDNYKLKCLHKSSKKKTAITPEPEKLDKNFERIYEIVKKEMKIEE